jgi:hypothetical protein
MNCDEILRVVRVSDATYSSGPGFSYLMMSDVLRCFTVSLGLSRHVPGWTSVLGYDLFPFHVPSFRHALVIVISVTV